MNHTPLNYALFLLGKRDRSVGEIQRKMKEKEYSSEEIKQTISFLLDKKFLDDEKFAKHFVKNQISFKPVGRYQLRQKLKQKYISEDLIEKTLAQLSSDDETDLAKAAAEKWLKKNTAYSIQSPADKEKLMRHLISRGFNWDIVKEVIEHLKTKN